jgi:hypothetical protein
MLYIETVSPFGFTRTFASVLELATMKGLVAFVEANQVILSCLVLYFVNMYSVRNIGRLSDGGVSAVSTWSGEPGRLGLILAILHVLLAGGALPPSVVWSASVFVVAQWLVLVSLSKY